jgi:hypothetical protein
VSQKRDALAHPQHAQLAALTGSAVSMPPYCEFTLSVSGQVYSNGQFFVETADNTTASFAGTLSNGNKTVSDSGPEGPARLSKH